jgi:hypothetical protein
MSFQIFLSLDLLSLSSTQSFISFIALPINSIILILCYHFFLVGLDIQKLWSLIISFHKSFDNWKGSLTKCILSYVVDWSSFGNNFVSNPD